MFRVWAPNASAVGVKGDFSGWGTQNLTSEGTGHWSADIAGASAGQQYKYVITYNGFTFDRNDARAAKVVNSVGNSVIYDHNTFDWQGDNFSHPWLNDLVIYEMHIGSYEPRDNGWTPGSFYDGLRKLDHLKNLGINCIELMPTFEFAGDHSWGYNPAHVYAIESAYGGPDGLKTFVREAHKKGIAVYMDIVHNHYGPSDLSLWQYDGWNQWGNGGIYFFNDDRRYTDWGETRPDYGRWEVKSFIKDSVRMLFDHYRISGLRWDAVYSMTHRGFDTIPEGETLVWEANQMIRNDYPGRISIAEDDAFGRDFHSEWDRGWHDGVKAQLTFGSDSERSASYVASIMHGGHHRVLYTESHDTVSQMNNKQRLPREIDSSDPESIWARKRVLLGAGLVMTSVGVPMIFQGQEMLEDWAFSDYTALRWDRTNYHAGITRAYTDLITQRRNRHGNTQGLKGGGCNTYHVDDNNKVIAAHRWDGGGVGDDVVVVLNWSGNSWNSSEYSINFPYSGTWYEMFNSDDQKYGADFSHKINGQVDANGAGNSAGINIGPYAVIVFARSNNQPTPIGIASFNPANPNGCEPVDITFDPNGGVLEGVSPIYAGTGHDDWEDPESFVMSESNGVWTYTYTPTSAVGVLNVVFHDGAGTYDNNDGYDWNIAFTDCAGRPSEAITLPSEPEGCEPVTVEYTAYDGPLMDASQVYLHLGFNNWDIFDGVVRPMTESNGVWSFTVTPPIGAWKMNFVFHDGNTNGAARIWDNNDYQDWEADVSACPMAHTISITDPLNASVFPFVDTNLDVTGEASVNSTGSIRVINLASGITNLVAANTNWTASAVQFEVGTNIVIAAIPDPMNRSIMQDSATNSAYADGWDLGDNGGVGFDLGWVLQGGGDTDHSYVDSVTRTNMDISTAAWAIAAENGALADAFRPLPGTLSVGSVLRVKMENGFIDTGKSVGIGLQNNNQESLFEVYFNGGDTFYTVNDGAGPTQTDINWTMDGFEVVFTLLSPTRYRVEIGAYVHEGALKAFADQSITRFRAWNYSANPGENGEFYFTDLEIQGEPWAAADFITVIRLPDTGIVDNDQDGLPDDWEQMIADANPADGINGPDDVHGWQDFDGDGFTNFQELLANTDPADIADYLWLDVTQTGAGLVDLAFDSETGRFYTLYYTDSLSAPFTWTAIPDGGSAITGDGSRKSITRNPSGGESGDTRIFRLELSL